MSSSSVYDTAWLSMVRKPDSSGKASWLFPECFEFIMARQLSSGSWESYATPEDGILNTSAALLALRTRLRMEPRDPNYDDWMSRSYKAEAALRNLLSDWEIPSSVDQAEVEILVASLLQLLEREGVYIDLPHLDALRAVREEMLASLHPSNLFNTTSTSHTHLEAFVGHIDFDQVGSSRDRDGSMMRSPASTAAYLMNCSVWDEEAEAYLRTIVTRDGSDGLRGVSSAWPTTFFESQVVTTLASAGLCVNERGTCGPSHIFNSFVAQKTNGFTPISLRDADDTTQKLVASYHMSQTGNLDEFIQTCGGVKHIITDPSDRNRCLSASCNALILLLELDNRDQNLPQIAKALRLLVDDVFRGRVQDKRHLNELYWMMLLARAFELIFRHYHLALAVFSLDVNLRYEVPMIALHILSKIFRAQQKNGSWSNVCEITSYGVLALSSLSRLPCVQQLGDGEILGAISLGKEYLYENRSRWGAGSYHWIDKVTSSSDMLSEAYCIAAAFIPTRSAKHLDPPTSMKECFLVQDNVLLGMRKAGKLLARTPLFRKRDAFTLRVAEMKAAFAMQLLNRQTPTIFPRTAKGKDKYVFFIPLVLTACAELRDCVVSLSSLHELMVLSVLNFLVDEYMEGVVERHFVNNLDAVGRVVTDLCAELSHKPTNGYTNGNETQSAHFSNGSETRPGSSNEAHVATDGYQDRPSVGEVKNVLGRYVAHILHHRDVLSSPAPLQARLARDLQKFLLAHLSHAEDNRRLRAQLDGDGPPPHESDQRIRATGLGAPAVYRDARQSFYQWVRSTSAEHTSCPFSFFFFNCLAHATSSSPSSSPVAARARSGDGILASARTAYLAEDACRHLASVCRMYNDLGSMTRDADERNLNSTNFPEFAQPRPVRGGSSVSDIDDARAKAKGELLWIAKYEEKGLATALDLLEGELGDGVLMGHLRFFVDVTELYGQIYVLEDVGTRTQ
ncbi:hypothetical protein F4802DRAFT_615787 [Xylaria palmicola]|nr:hypothetical protein F4802DRAFT_615787 [Xylaria palmicola]